MCGGPSSQQKDAAASQAQLTQQQAQVQAQDNAVTQPFFTNEVQKGLPYFNAESQYSTSNLAKQVNQAKAGLAANRAGYGGALPSGFAASQDTDLAAKGAEAFDANQLNMLDRNQQEKDNAARALAGQQGLALTSAFGGNNSIMQAPLSNNFWGNLIQGVIQGGSKVASAYAGA